MASKKENVASVPVMITRAMEADLKASGFSQEQIDTMTPQQAHHYISAAKVAEVAAAPERVEDSAPATIAVIYDGPLPHVAIHVGRTSVVSLARGVEKTLPADVAADLIARKKVRAASSPREASK